MEDIKKKLVEAIREADDAIREFEDLTRLVIRYGFGSAENAMKYIEAFNKSLGIVETRNRLARLGRTAYDLNIE